MLRPTPTRLVSALACLCALAAASGCGGGSKTHPGADAGKDGSSDSGGGGRDGGVGSDGGELDAAGDSSPDATVDGSIDGSVDSGPDQDVSPEASPDANPDGAIDGGSDSGLPHDGGTTDSGVLGGGEGGITAGPPGTGLVSAGTVSHSANYTLVGSLGQSPGGNTTSASPMYQLRGGLVGSTQGP